jgi:hypothetical protein
VFDYFQLFLKTRLSPVFHSQMYLGFIQFILHTRFFPTQPDSKLKLLLLFFQKQPFFALKIHRKKKPSSKHEFSFIFNLIHLPEHIFLILFAILYII